MEVEITHPEKVLFPGSGITKKDLVTYYEKVAPYMLPHLDGRPISMHRFPNGIDEKGFYQKEAQDYFPSYIKQVRIKLKNGSTKCYVRIDSAATLMYLANLGTIPVHTWLSRKGHLSRPDLLIWDLDPSDNDFEKVREGAFILKEKLETEYKIEPFVKTTGSRGLHLVVPLKVELLFSKAKDFALKVSEELAEAHPDLFTVESRKDARGDRVFLDYLRNSFAQTAVAPYSVRERERAPVAMPLDWSEVKRKDMHPQRYHIGNAMRRLESKGDIWKDIFKKPVSLKQLLKEIKK